MKNAMKHVRLGLLVAMLGLFSLATFAQSSSLVVFNELKEDFMLTINGTRINDLPAQHIRVTGLQPSLYKVEVLFVNAKLPRQSTDILISAGRETSYALMRGNASSGPLAFYFLSEFSTGYFPIAPQAAISIAYTGPVGSQTVQPQPVIQQPQVITPQPIVDDRPNPLPGYKGVVGCPYPMDPTEFEDAKKSIAAKSFSDTKMQLAQQVTRNNCLLTSQVSEFIALFSFEAQKLEFAKFAFDFTYDRGNYYKINDAFSFESSTRELEKYLQGK